MNMVRTWRFHFYAVIADIFSLVWDFDAGRYTIPVDFSPLENYFDGFTVEYRDIKTLPKEKLAALRAAGEAEEGWNFIDKKNGVIYIFYDRSLSAQRQRFTICHEWAHVFQKIDCAFKADMEAVPDPQERKEIIESVAHHFAAAYLIPHPLLTELVNDDMTREQLEQYVPILASYFNVSKPAMEIRLINHRALIKR